MCERGVHTVPRRNTPDSVIFDRRSRFSRQTIFISKIKIEKSIRKIYNSIPSVESISINACASFDRFIPVKSDRFALENRNCSISYEVGEHRQPHGP